MEDREPLRNKNFMKKICCRLFADKGYIGQELWKLLGQYHHRTHHI
ncbi:MAG: hypothetical protein ABJJ25_12560 [Eudoraea sp.]